MQASQVSCCPTCPEPDHEAQDCARLRHWSPSSLPVRQHSRPGKTRPPNRTSTAAGAPYAQVCYLWNNGTCVQQPNLCCFEHICTKCTRAGARRAHKLSICWSLTLTTSHQPIPPDPQYSLLVEAATHWHVSNGNCI